jgi:hypothetical protein
MNGPKTLPAQAGHSRPGWRTALKAASAAARCTARGERTGRRCKGPVVQGWIVCRLRDARGGQPAAYHTPPNRHEDAREAEVVRNVVNGTAREGRTVKEAA